MVDDALIGASNFLTLFAIPTDYLRANFGLAPALCGRISRVLNLIRSASRDMALPDVPHRVTACERRGRQWSDTPRFAAATSSTMPSGS